MTHSKSPPISLRRMTGTFVFLVMAALTVYFAVVASRLGRQFDEWTVAEPVRFAVDLSRVGKFEAPFVQSFQGSHGESILLRVDGADDAASLVAGLRGKLDILDAHGNVTETCEISDEQVVSSMDTANELLLAYFYPFANGQYTLRLEVTDPAPALAGRTQTVYARYELCGLERMPADIVGGLSWITGLVALTIGVFTSIGLMRYGWRCRAEINDAGHA